MKKIFLIVCISVISVSQIIAGGGNGKSGLAFLKIGVGGRAVGMGEAFTTIADDASASYWNPSALMNRSQTNVVVMHNEWFQGIRTEFIGIHFGGEDNPLD